MANKNLPNSFKVINPELCTPEKFLVDADYAGVSGDMVWLESEGYASDTNANPMIGIQAGEIQNVTTTKVTAGAGSSTKGESFIMVYNKSDIEFVGQISTGALTDPYTTATSAACFDVAGSAGVQYVDAGSHSNDAIRVVRDYIEPDTGLASAAGAYQKKVFRMNSDKHYLRA